MKRRDLLATVGSAGALFAAGCVGYDTSRGAGVENDDPDPDDEPTGREGDGTDGGTGSDGTDGGDGTGSDPAANDEPVATVPVGDREGVPFPDNNGPHGVSVVNDADQPRELRIVLNRDDEQVLDRGFDVPAGRAVALTLNEPGDYEVAVGADGRLLDTVGVRRALFDCNGSTTEVTVDDDSEVDSTTVSTLVACPGPEIADTRFDQGEGTCGGADRASVATDGERVWVSGTVRTPVPCYDLALSGVELVEAEEYGGRSGTLVVTVTTAGRQDGACVECVGSVSYEAAVDLDNAYPKTVRVVHVGLSGERTVTETTPA